MYADGDDYESLSLGQRSIFGIKYKYNRSLNEDLFLDQPEDNLDNHTIATDIIDMIKNKPSDCQIFIVTHNANIGILTNCKNVIVANLASEENKYQCGELVMHNDELAASYFLEGGNKQLSDRYDIIIKNKGN